MTRQAMTRMGGTAPLAGQCAADWVADQACGDCARCRAVARHAAALMPDLAAAADDLLTALQSRLDDDGLRENTALIRRAVRLLGQARVLGADKPGGRARGGVD